MRARVILWRCQYEGSRKLLTLDS